MHKRGFAPILILLLIVGVGAVGIFAYKSGQLNPHQPGVLLNTPIPSNPSKTFDPNLNWKTYINQKYSYSFKCPETSMYKNGITNGDGNTKPLFEELCYDSKNQLSISVYPKVSTQTLENFKEGAFAVEIDSDSNRIFIRGFDKIYFDQILSTFKFLDSPSATPISCAGFAGIKCPSGYSCIVKETYPDSLGVCVKTENYSCPASGYLDCMPGPDTSKLGCSKEALSWYGANCPDFKGVAY